MRRRSSLERRSCFIRISGLREFRIGLVRVRLEWVRLGIEFFGLRINFRVRVFRVWFEWLGINRIRFIRFRLIGFGIKRLGIEFFGLRINFRVRVWFEWLGINRLRFIRLRLIGLRIKRLGIGFFRLRIDFRVRVFRVWFEWLGINRLRFIRFWLIRLRIQWIRFIRFRLDGLGIKRLGIHRIRASGSVERYSCQQHSGIK